MSTTVHQDVAVLRRMTVKQLRERHLEVFGEETAGHNKAWLVKRIAWRLQALAEGDLSERARRRAAELANDADLRTNPPRPPAEPAPRHDESATLRFRQHDRLPPPGSVLTQPYKGGVVQVKVLADGFEYEGQVYPSLSAVARAITGSHCNGYLFFKIGRQGEKA